MRLVDRTHDNNIGIQEAVKYLVHEIERYCDNTKPLITHCVRVAFLLDFYGYDKEVVQAALLHDLLEDTKATKKEIEIKFGRRVASLVQASTFDKKIDDKKERYKVSFDNALRSGKDALVIRASDLLDNSFYYSLVGDQRVYDYLLEKLSYFLELSKSKIGGEKIYFELKDKLSSLRKK